MENTVERSNGVDHYSLWRRDLQSPLHTANFLVSFFGVATFCSLT
jgi:hypothetical protein